MIDTAKMRLAIRVVREVAKHLQRFSDGGQYRNIPGPSAGAAYDAGKELLGAADGLESLFSEGLDDPAAT